MSKITASVSAVKGIFKHKKRTISPLELWDNIIADICLRDKSDKGIRLSDLFYLDTRGIYSGAENVTYMYTIDGLPKELDISFRDVIRDECREGVRVSFINRLFKHKLDWTSPQMKSRLKTWETLDENMGDVNSYNLHQNLAMLDSQAWKRQSLEYLSTAEIRRKRKTFKIYSVFFVSGKRGENFDDSIKAIKTVCHDLGLKATRVTINIKDFLEVFSPFSCKYNRNILNTVGSNVLTDELIARFNTYSQGKVGRIGICWGTDIYSGFPCMKQYKITPESAENWLITAETGGGKSYMVKYLILQLLSSPLVNGTIMDIEGFEYLYLAYFMRKHEEVVIINMAEGTGAYFDPVEVILTGDEELDKDMLSLSKSFTTVMLKTLLGDIAKDVWATLVVEKAISETYKSRGIQEEDMSTWGNSKGLSLFSVYEQIKTLDFDIMYKELLDTQELDKNSREDFNRAKTLVLAKLSESFEKEGSNAGMFRKKVSTSKIVTAKLVICSFGMAGKSEKSVDSVHMALMQLCAANISHIRSVFSKFYNKYNFKLWEEFQRWGKFPDSDRTIGTALTGGRKLGDINIIITNLVRELLDDDRFGIFSTITSIAIGCIWDADVRKRLCDRLSIPKMLPELNRLVTENKDVSAYTEGDDVNDNPYNKAFLIGLDKTVYSIARVSLPDEIRTSDLFRTGVEIQDSNDIYEEMYEEI